MSTSISKFNNNIHTACKDFFTSNNVGYIRLYRDPFVENSTKSVANNIDGRSIKYYGCRPSKTLINKLNKNLKKYNVKAIQLVGEYPPFTSSSIRIVNI